ncbi:MAG TPA: hypothetical protein VFA29_11645 [Candidatus Baltobacteraceae bacterium]|nr:hypothetical protein [Candidatus Baltobacteraceae bacterium]
MAKPVIKNEPSITDVRYDAREDRIRLFFRNNRFIDIPRKDIEELRGLRADELQLLKADNAGMTISQRERDIDVYIPGLLQELFFLQPAAALGRKGGSRKSPAKTRASVANGAKGGRPRKEKLATV